MSTAFDPSWDNKRQDILDRDRSVCNVCKQKCEPAHRRPTVHHGYYRRRADYSDYSDDTLWTLCWPCHTHAQRQLLEAHILIGTVAPETYSELLRRLREMDDLAHSAAADFEIDRVEDELPVTLPTRFHEYSVIMDSDEDIQPDARTAAALCERAEAAFPELQTTVNSSERAPHLVASVEGPRPDVVAVIEDWFGGRSY